MSLARRGVPLHQMPSMEDKQSEYPANCDKNKEVKMYKKIAIGCLLTTTAWLSACNSSSDNSQQSTPLSKQQLAHDFALNIEGAVQSVDTVSDHISDFAAAFNTDLEQLDANALATAAGSAGDFAAELYEYLKTGITENDDGYVTAIDWTTLATSTQSNGFLFTRNEDHLVVSSNGDREVSLSVEFTLPDIAITDEQAVFAFNDFKLTEGASINIQIASGKLTLDSVYGPFNSIQHKSNTPDWFNVSMAAENSELNIGSLAFSGKLYLSGSRNGILWEGDTLFERISNIFAFSINGPLSVSSGLQLMAKTDVTFNARADCPYYSSMASSIKVNLDLTDQTSAKQQFIAGLTLDFTLDDASIISDDRSIDIRGNYNLTLGSEVDIQVGDKAFGLGLNLDHKNNKFQNGTLFDNKNTDHDIRLRYIENADADFNAGAVRIGEIIVDGERQANVLLDIEQHRVVAEFTNLDNVVLIAPDDLVL